VAWWRGKGAPSPLYKGPPLEEERTHNFHEPSSTASSYRLLVRRPLPLSLSIPRGLWKGCVGDENHHRQTLSCCAVSGSLSKAIYFRSLAGNGVPGVTVVAVRVRVCGGAAHVVPESLLEDLHDLKVGYVVFIVKHFGLQGYVSKTSTVTELLIDRFLGKLGLRSM
jgi:hypothetical protein